MTPQEKAEAALAAFRDEVECPTCHEYGKRATIEQTGRCDGCYYRRVMAMRRIEMDERREHRDTWKVSDHGHF